MPTSLLAHAPRIVNLVEEIPADRRRILDIGPGHGKYGLLLREYLNAKPTRLVAVEKHRPYLQEWGHRLAAIYDEVYLADGVELGAPDLEAWAVDRTLASAEGPLEAGALWQTYLDEDFLDGFDVVLLLDVIEHFEKEAALELLDRIPGWIIVSTPEHFFRSVPGHPTEEHRSHWTRDDFGARIGKDVSADAGIVVRLAPLS